MTNIPPTAAEPLLYLKNFAVTNSLFTTSLLVLGFVLFGYVFKQKLAKSNPDKPNGLTNFVESIVESLLEFMDRVTNGRERSIRFLPLVGGVYSFILVSNWLGLLPGIGRIGFLDTYEEVRQAIEKVLKGHMSKEQEQELLDSAISKLKEEGRDNAKN